MNFYELIILHHFNYKFKVYCLYFLKIVIFAPTLTVMKGPKDFKNIQEIRDSIDEIDFRILKLFGDRNRCVEEIVNFKKDKAGVIAKKRQVELLALRRKWAEDFNLNPDLFEKIFKMLIKNNIQKEMEMLEQYECNNVKSFKTPQKNV
jgi:chorismate mutase